MGASLEKRLVGKPESIHWLNVALCDGAYISLFNTHDMALPWQASNANSFSASMFPDEDSAKMPLDRCMRILPHHGDTGGFFIAVMEKRADLPPLQPER